ncbi:response regulator transcription factor [Jiangella alkaliphila]|uniref:DNA-binding response regulator, OmpR family, contains REC and winged-helix (WHTH) domain n=1 Tax=Jiangella alkaliphila TaxID=419479 RepID=A0A1H2GNS2_9ACTN|nr:response regulator transcription factor [Jiangella alkaliphila]SDU21038.1 DNA-binding response regulator, OmpR family, contains REC and winged-helix (wHTH) domain [Jiangella alkaliphila]
MNDDQDCSLLLVEDDAKLAALLDRLFTGEGYAVDVARDGQSGLHRALTSRYAVMVIDRGLPAIEGVDLVRKLRAQGVATPILILTARGTTDDRVEGLDAGAEDYVVKPFEIDELLARLRALLRRHTDTSTRLELGERYLDVTARRVLGGAAGPIELSGRENQLLQLFAAHPSQVFTRDELRRQVFQDADSPGAVDTYVYYLRRKLGRDVIRTVHGLGYRMGSA